VRTIHVSAPAPANPRQNGGAILYSQREDEVRRAARQVHGCSAWMVKPCVVMITVTLPLIPLT